MQGTVLYKTVQHISEQGLKDCILQKHNMYLMVCKAFFSWFLLP